MYKFIFSDLDGTLLDDNKNVSKENLEAINYAQDKGVKFIVCTGRAPFYVEDPLKQIGHYKDARKLLIGFNGGIILDGDLNVIDSRPLDSKLAKALFEYAVEQGDLAVVACFEDAYLRYNTKALGELQKVWGWWQENTTVKDALRDINRKKCYKIFMAHPNQEHILDVIEYIKKNISSDLEFTFSTDCALEINPKNVTKGTGIKRLLKLLNGNIEETIGVGDHINDIEMLKTCKLACCPNNAKDETKEVCDYVCKNDNNHGAIAEIINKYIK